MKYSKRQIVGIILWWTEGTKATKDKRFKNTWNYTVDMTNTDSRIIKLFLEFLRKDIKIDETRLKSEFEEVIKTILVDERDIKVDRFLFVLYTIFSGRAFYT